LYGAPTGKNKIGVSLQCHNPFGTHGKTGSRNLNRRLPWDCNGKGLNGNRNAAHIPKSDSAHLYAGTPITRLSTTHNSPKHYTTPKEKSTSSNFTLSTLAITNTDRGNYLLTISSQPSPMLGKILK